MKVAVIGAGHSGLSCSKWLLQNGIDVVVFEQRNNVGGMWYYDPSENGYSQCYESLSTNTPKRLTDNGKTLWKVTHQDVRDEKGTLISENLDAVAICIGHHWYPKYPNYVHKNTAQTFKGTLIHSSSYRKPDKYKDRIVVLVGISVSAREILNEVRKVAKKVILSSSRYQQGLAVLLENREYETQSPETQSHSVDNIQLIPPLTGISEHSITYQNENGNTEHIEVDCIIFCTGYKIHVPFMDPKYLPVELDGSVISLYKRVIFPTDPSLAFIGFVTTFGSLHPISEVQSQLFANVLAKKISLPSSQEMLREIEEWKKNAKIDQITENSSSFYRPMNVSYWDYIADIHNYIKAGLKAHKNTQVYPPATVKVASLQASSNPRDNDGNINKFVLLAREAAKNGAKIIVMPEAAITGYVTQDLKYNWWIEGRPLSNRPNTNDPFLPMEDLQDFAETVPGKATNVFSALAKELKVYIVVAFIEKAVRDTQKKSDAAFFKPSSSPYIFYNSCVLISPTGDVVAHYRKNNLWGCVDNSWCTAARDPVIYDTEYGRIGLAICFDVHIMLKKYQPYGLWALLYPIAWVDNDIQTWFEIDLPQRVAQYGIFKMWLDSNRIGHYVVGANWSVDGQEQGKNWMGYGHSTIYDPQGKILAKAKTLYGSEIIYAELQTRPTQSNSTPSVTAPASNNNATLPSDISSDLLTLQNEPAWTRRSKTTRERFVDPYYFDMDGVQLCLKQGGNAEHLGMTVWDTALVMARMFQNMASKNLLDLKGKTVLELGSGTGLLGIVCAYLGANVILTDIGEPFVLNLLKSNVDANINNSTKASKGTTPGLFRLTQSGTAKVTALSWGESLPDLPSNIDLIVASDVVYSNHIVQPLVNTLKELCSRNTKPLQIYLGYESHHLQPLKHFFDLIRQDFDIEEVPSHYLHKEYTCGGIGVKKLTSKVGQSTEQSLYVANLSSCTQEQLLHILQQVSINKQHIMKKLNELEQLQQLVVAQLMTKMSHPDSAVDNESNMEDIKRFLEEYLKIRPDVDTVKSKGYL